MKLANEIIDLPLGRNDVKGMLSGDEQNWTFQCLNREFLKLFPEGRLHSFSYFGLGIKYYEHRCFQLAVADRMKELLVRSRAAAPAALRQNARVGARRFVIPRLDTCSQK